MTLTRAACEALDRDDPLAAQRALFSLPHGVIYLDGNSLGALPKAVRGAMGQALDREWGQNLIKSWNTAGWIDLPTRVGAKIAPLIGAAPHEVIAADSTSVNLFKLAAAALKLRPGRRTIITEPGNFPTDLYILQGLKAFHPDLEIRVLTPAQIASEPFGDDVAALLLTQVHYKTGEIHDMAALTAKAHAAGALAIWDLSHSAGAIAVDLNGCGADLAVGCGYKYLNGGPGAPAFLFIARHLQADFKTPLSGWMGHARPFAFVDQYEAGEGVMRALCGTPSVLGLKALEAALGAFDGVDMADVRAKSMAMGDLFIRLVEERCPGFGLACPRDGARRGSQVALTHEHGYPIMQALIARGVIGDFRAPDVLRFGFAPLYVRFVDVWDAVGHLVEVMSAEQWREPRFHEVSSVT